MEVYGKGMLLNPAHQYGDDDDDDDDGDDDESQKQIPRGKTRSKIGQRVSCIILELVKD